MAIVHTVTGDVEPEDLGWTMPHEHIVIGFDGTQLDSTLSLDWPAIEAAAAASLLRAKATGVRTIVDMTTIEMMRDADLLRRLSERTGVQIICCSGLFADEYGIPHYFRQLGEEEFTEIFVHEVEEGIGGTGVRAGVIKVATGGREVTPIEESIIRAAGVAAARTGVPVLTHTGRGAGGERQIELLTGAGMAPEKIVIGHSDVSANLKFHLRLLKAGAFVGFDRIGLPAFMPDPVRAQCIASLVRLGYVGQLMMSLDTHVRWCGRPQPLGAGDREFTTLADDFFPLLRDAGVTDDDIHQMMVENPRRLFS
ncbi:MAG: phosphotriesterase [Acidimicrobiia bacterium]